ncbi:MAG: hypothetical protein AB7E96_10365 [Deferribacterales bacterium]
MLKKLDYPTLIVFSVLLGLAPFIPEPHIWQKLKMLAAGTLKKPIDIFDLVFHAAPMILLAAKFFVEKILRKG